MTSNDDGIDEIKKNLRQELKGADIDKISKEVRTEVDEVAKKKYATVLD
ncbi:MAG: hypothetical protein KAT05_00720 [Spirochaetes bacterium]|nr:hypothetical protein [Spirochaetota bacterium]